MKRIAIIFCSMLILVNTFPVVTGYFVFADSPVASIPSGYTAISDNEKFTQCFLAYCRSRDADIVGGVPNAVATFTYSSIVKAASQLGIDITRLQAELFYKQEANQGIQWFMTSTGVSAFNEIFAQLITDQGLTVGDSDVNENLYNGLLFVDDSDNKCLVYTVNSNNVITEKGTPYLYSYEQMIGNIVNNADFDFQSIYTGSTWNFRVTYRSSVYRLIYDPNNSNTRVTIGNNQYTNSSGCLCVFKYENSNVLYLGATTPYDNPVNVTSFVSIGGTSNFQSVNINFITINNNSIKNEYQGDTTINNEGDTIINNNPSDPSGPIDYDPYPDGGGTTTNPHSPNDPDSDNNINIDFPDIDIDLPEIDWSIGDLSNKFPFSIPFDLYNMFSILNVEPQTPEIKGNVNLGIYQWSIAWDLHQFDDTAQLLRNVEFIGFVIGLIFITRNIMKG